jgi:AcrR family transcriptional regulator
MAMVSNTKDRDKRRRQPGSGPAKTERAARPLPNVGASTPTPSRRERKKQSTRQVLFETAVRLFATHGFDGPTIDQIAAAADIGKGTFYNYFSSKEEILVAFMVELEAKTGARLGRFSEASGPLARILCDFVRYQFRLKRPYYDFIRVFLAELIRRGPQLRSYVARMQQVADPPLMALFTRLKERGLIKASADIETAVQTFKTIHFGVSCLWAATGPSLDAANQALAEQIGAFARSISRRKE